MTYFLGILLILFQVMSESLCSFDLFIEREDAKVLLGVSSQLWYAENGKLNENALSYVVLVPMDITQLTFFWRNNLNSTMPYSMNIDISNKHAIHEPTFKNIKHRGLVPNKITSWKVTLNCTGKFITQSHVNITLKVPMEQSLESITPIVIKRRKICTERKRKSITMVASSVSSTIAFIIGGLSVAFLALIACLASFSHFRRLKMRQRQNCAQTHLNRPIDFSSNMGRSDESQAYSYGLRVINISDRGESSECHGEEVQMLPKMDRTDNFSFEKSSSALQNGSSSRLTGQNSSTASCSSVLLNKSNINFINTNFKDPRIDNIEGKLMLLRGDAESVTVSTLVMEGTFGRMHKGFHQPKTGGPIEVLIKTVSEHASEIQRGIVISEGIMLADLSHENILTVFLAVTETDQPPMIVFHGSGCVNLKTFLNDSHSLMTKDVVLIGAQVLEGLLFIHSKAFVHKDIACRNCVITESKKVKIADSALSRDFFPSDYHCLGDNDNRPIKWLAFESLKSKIFTPASDVWSWGVLLWEVMTLGQPPYIEIDSFEMLSVLEQGIRLAQPINCPDQLYKAMTYCWMIESSQRPTVQELILYLNKFNQHLSNYV